MKIILHATVIILLFEVQCTHAAAVYQLQNQNGSAEVHNASVFSANVSNIHATNSSLDRNKNRHPTARQTKPKNQTLPVNRQVQQNVVNKGTPLPAIKKHANSTMQTSRNATTTKSQRSGVSSSQLKNTNLKNKIKTSNNRSSKQTPSGIRRANVPILQTNPSSVDDGNSGEIGCTIDNGGYTDVRKLIQLVQDRLKASGLSFDEAVAGIRKFVTSDDCTKVTELSMNAHNAAGSLADEFHRKFQIKYGSMEQLFQKIRNGEELPQQLRQEFSAVVISVDGLPEKFKNAKVNVEEIADKIFSCTQSMGGNNNADNGDPMPTDIDVCNDFQQNAIEFRNVVGTMANEYETKFVAKYGSFSKLLQNVHDNEETVDDLKKGINEILNSINGLPEKIKESNFNVDNYIDNLFDCAQPLDNTSNLNQDNASPNSCNDCRQYALKIIYAAGKSGNDVEAKFMARYGSLEKIYQSIQQNIETFDTLNKGMNEILDSFDGLQEELKSKNITIDNFVNKLLACGKGNDNKERKYVKNDVSQNVCDGFEKYWSQLFQIAGTSANDLQTKLAAKYSSFDKLSQSIRDNIETGDSLNKSFTEIVSSIKGLPENLKNANFEVEYLVSNMIMCAKSSDSTADNNGSAKTNVKQRCSDFPQYAAKVMDAVGTSVDDVNAKLMFKYGNLEKVHQSIRENKETVDSLNKGMNEILGSIGGLKEKLTKLSFIVDDYVNALVDCAKSSDNEVDNKDNQENDSVQQNSCDDFQQYANNIIAVAETPTNEVQAKVVAKYVSMMQLFQNIRDNSETVDTLTKGINEIVNSIKEVPEKLDKANLEVDEFVKKLIGCAKSSDNTVDHKDNEKISIVKQTSCDDFQKQSSKISNTLGTSQNDIEEKWTAKYGSFSTLLQSIQDNKETFNSLSKGINEILGSVDGLQEKLKKSNFKVVDYVNALFGCYKNSGNNTGSVENDNTSSNSCNDIEQYAMKIKYMYVADTSGHTVETKLIARFGSFEKIYRSIRDNTENADSLKNGITEIVDSIQGLQKKLQRANITIDNFVNKLLKCAKTTGSTKSKLENDNVSANICLDFKPFVVKLVQAAGPSKEELPQKLAAKYGDIERFYQSILDNTQTFDSLYKDLNEIFNSINGLSENSTNFKLDDFVNQLISCANSSTLKNSETVKIANNPQNSCNDDVQQYALKIQYAAGVSANDVNKKFMAKYGSVEKLFQNIRDNVETAETLQKGFTEIVNSINGLAYKLTTAGISMKDMVNTMVACTKTAVNMENNAENCTNVVQQYAEKTKNIAGTLSANLTSKFNAKYGSITNLLQLVRNNIETAESLKKGLIEIGNSISGLSEKFQNSGFNVDNFVNEIIQCAKSNEDGRSSIASYND